MSPAQVKSDFVNVRLSDAGRTFAGSNGKVRIANAHMDYTFRDNASQRVLTSEWTKIFAIERCEGGMMFELEPVAPVVFPVTKAAPPATPAAAAAKPATTESQPAVQTVAVATQEK